ncbi:hypothetical protein GALL_541010 [mine drainage metagenome]|uniref:Uncharacterized protein n=1 Tax=mine drainage metagenome TaxID=410659 RepID=A0A1J5PA42_9ZZZZ
MNQHIGDVADALLSGSAGLEMLPGAQEEAVVECLAHAGIKPSEFAQQGGANEQDRIDVGEAPQVVDVDIGLEVGIDVPVFRGQDVAVGIGDLPVRMAADFQRETECGVGREGIAGVQQRNPVGIASPNDIIDQFARAVGRDVRDVDRIGNRQPLRLEAMVGRSAVEAAVGQDDKLQPRHRLPVGLPRGNRFLRPKLLARRPAVLWQPWKDALFRGVEQEAPDVAHFESGGLNGERHQRLAHARKALRSVGSGAGRRPGVDIQPKKRTQGRLPAPENATGNATLPSDVEPQPHGVGIRLQQVDVRQSLESSPEAAGDDGAQPRIRGKLRKDGQHGFR